MNKHIATHSTIALLAAVFGFAAPGYAATTDLATQPMAVTSSASIKPNILFLLDDSGSMALGQAESGYDGEHQLRHQFRAT